jgi:DNA/RNA endonuclease YhcR with UshA esterase domain
MMRRFSLLVLLMAPVVLAAGEQPAKPLTPADAAKQVGKKVTVEMEVKSVGKGKGVFFLNSEKNFKDEKNFTLFIDKAGAKKFEEAKIDPTNYEGKTVRARGEVKLYRERPEIIVTEPKQLEIVEKKKAAPKSP